MKHVQARLSDEEYRELVILSLDKGMKLQELLKLALRALLEVEGRRKKEVTMEVESKQS